MRALRLARGWTQEELAEQADMHWTFISGVERGLKDPRVTTVARLAQALGVPVEELFAPAVRPRRNRSR